ncbi:hypothetical protein ZOSMA_221G00330 [Zostera marina]|uniref:Uncharacterized protein n=1 Tax=Zostera marina TaxID=29655 RepID=A0A0K9PJJ9_ZOSMR|nr:hypothetical protein ZOSMA_221G00330 [Zostera marina]
MDGQRERGSEQVLISEFEHSIDKFFEVSNRISEICGDSEKTVDPEELQRCSSMVTFLKKWKYFNCKPKIVNFAYENDVPGLSKMVIKDIHLSQFSSASIPKIEPVGDKSGFLNCEDYILHAGGSIWSLDWCPKISEISDSQSKCEVNICIFFLQNRY